MIVPIHDIILHFSLPRSWVGLATSIINLSSDVVAPLFLLFPIHIAPLTRWNQFDLVQNTLIRSRPDGTCSNQFEPDQSGLSKFHSVWTGLNQSVLVQLNVNWINSTSLKRYIPIWSWLSRSKQVWSSLDSIILVCNGPIQPELDFSNFCWSKPVQPSMNYFYEHKNGLRRIKPVWTSLI